MSSVPTFQPNADFCQHAHIKSMHQYREMYQESVNDPTAFWSKIAERIHWFKKWDKVVEYDFVEANINWFQGGKLNISYNCLDRHIEGENAWRRNKAAIIWEGEPGDSRVITYAELHRDVCRFANVLKAHGVGRRDRVVLYLPMIPEAAVAMLACTRIGATHSIVFGGFSAEALRDRIVDAVFANFEPVILCAFFTVAGLHLSLHDAAAAGGTALLFLAGRPLRKLISADPSMRIPGATALVRRHRGTPRVPPARVPGGPARPRPGEDTDGVVQRQRAGVGPGLGGDAAARPSRLASVQRVQNGSAGAGDGQARTGRHAASGKAQRGGGQKLLIDPGEPVPHPLLLVGDDLGVGGDHI